MQNDFTAPETLSGREGLEYIQLVCETLCLGAYLPEYDAVDTSEFPLRFRFRYNYTPLSREKEPPAKDLREFATLEKWKKKLGAYRADEHLQTLVEKAGLDSGRLWFFTLWASDYAYGQCQDNIVIGRSTRQTLKELADAIRSNLLSVNWRANQSNYLSEVETEQPASLSLKIGKQTWQTDDARAIALIAKALLDNNLFEEIDGLDYATIDFSQQAPTSDSQTTALFCRLMETLLDHLPGRKREQRPDALRTNAERELTLRLAHLTGLLKLDLKTSSKGNEIQRDFKSYYKTLMKRYGDDDLKQTNRHYHS